MGEFESIINKDKSVQHSSQDDQPWSTDGAVKSQAGGSNAPHS